MAISCMSSLEQAMACYSLHTIPPLHHLLPRPATAFAHPIYATQLHGVSIITGARRSPSCQPWKMDGAAMNKEFSWWVSRSIRPGQKLHCYIVCFGKYRKVRRTHIRSANTFSCTSELGLRMIKYKNHVRKSLWQAHRLLPDARGTLKASSLSQLAKETSQTEWECEADEMASALVSRSSLESLSSSNGGVPSEGSTISAGCAASISALKGNSTSKKPLQGRGCSEDARHRGGEAHCGGSRSQHLILEEKNISPMVGGPRDGEAGPDEARRFGLNTIRSRLAKLREAGKRGFMNGTSYAVDADQLIPGEYVVHKKVGIGRFVVVKDGIPEGKKKPIPYVYLQYADGMAKLPAKQACRLLYRYNPVGESCRKPPPLNRLHDTSLWESKKSAGKLAIQKLVVAMVEQTVRRLKQARSCYLRNDKAIADFAALFKHIPTPDQQQAFYDVEEDMTVLESPMDRLICGDVGFGKTEVALRAIFIALDSGKQSMVLAPTTVLAKQHYEVISDRFSSYSDAKVALLTRFQKGVEKRKLLAGICDGSLNIIIGTHGLLSDQLQYGNLGLLVVDEEQRFGVKQKEMIASLKATVDVLTLSATPIPRTLYMGLNGFRDISLLTTPPLQRLPIVTRISEYSDEQVKGAIEFELKRGGQVFYVVPRIKDIEHKRQSIISHFPEAEVVVAHGQQSMSLLEGGMERFSKGKGQVLLCTSIVESGLDIPRVNTIIIEDAQLFGLAQLYQLRGRVGRGELEGHAYMFHPRTSVMGTEALQRLKAVKDCCGLGQGFQLAERDMIIRGIGSVFTEQQSGDMSTLGVNLYAEMLFESLSNQE